MHDAFGRDIPVVVKINRDDRHNDPKWLKLGPRR